jgi:hypothetical protein
MNVKKWNKKERNRKKRYRKRGNLDCGGGLSYFSKNGNSSGTLK